MKQRPPRINRAFLVWFRRPGQAEWQASPLRDLSLAGAKFLSEVPFRVGTRLELQLRFPGGVAPLSVSATVVWMRARSLGNPLTEVGVFFLSQEPAVREAIHAAVAQELDRHGRSR